MTERYSSKDQERFFRTQRIKLVEVPTTRYKNPDYQVWIVDMLTPYAAPIVWCGKNSWHGTGGWQGWSDKLPDNCYYQSTWVSWQEHDVKDVSKDLTLVYAQKMTKGDALEIAKREAVRRDLPFNLQDEIITIDDFARGPVQNCVSCGEATRRSFEVQLCKECKEAVEIGQNIRSDENKLHGALSPWLIDKELFDYHSPLRKYGNEEKLYEVLSRLLQTYIGRSSSTNVDKLDFYVERGHEKTRRNRSVYLIDLSQGQVDAVQILVDYISQIAEEAHKNGMRNGSSTLLNLAGGTMAMIEMEDEERVDGD